MRVVDAGTLDLSRSGALDTLCHRLARDVAIKLQPLQNSFFIHYQNHQSSYLPSLLTTKNTREYVAIPANTKDFPDQSLETLCDKRIAVALYYSIAMTDSPPTEPRARSKSPAPRDRDDRKGRDDPPRENAERRQRRDRSWSRDRNNNRDRRDSPPRRPRDRSRSPARRPRGSGGFKWKGERRDNDRNRDFRRRSPQRHRDRDDGRDRNYRRDDRGGGRGGRDRQRDGDRDQRREKKEKNEDKPKAPAPQGGGEEMIIVNVNDRLGTKAAVPCLESDTVGQLKMMVAARIGRDPGQIILKRQSERPFKDHITLGDYGISNGVQLDLEIDTRD